jgi:hypothetical protein
MSDAALCCVVVSFIKEDVMPLKSGKSRETVSKNIKTLVHDYEHKGAIGKTRPGSKKKAIKQAVAISLKKAGKSKYQKQNQQTSQKHH